MTATKITFAGHSAVFVEFGGLKVAVDPWLQGNPSCPRSLQDPNDLDLIVLTHGHADHAGDVVRLASLSTTKIIATYELAMILIGEGIAEDRLIGMNKGGSTEVNGVTVRLTHAFHSSSYDSPSRGTLYAGEPCGVLLSAGSTSVFHAGDTALFSDLSLIGELYQPSVVLLPIGDLYTMGPKEAAIAAQRLKARIAIPIHYGTFPALTGSPTDFKKHCLDFGIEVVELAPGESFYM